MMCNLAGLVMFLSVFGIVASTPGKAVDCRKFVFAPSCRGVAAKRGGLSSWHDEPIPSTDEKSFRNLVRNIYLAIGKPEVEEEEEEDYRSGKSTNKQEETENPIKKYQLERDNRFLRLLMDNGLKGRSYSETDNVPVQQLRNL